MLDFADGTKALRYPQHGWATNSQGIRILWLPILRLFRPKLVLIGSESHVELGDWRSTDRFFETLSKLVPALRELHRHLDSVAQRPLHPDNTEHIGRDLGDFEMIPVFLDMAYVYMRRLADDFAAVSHYVLFKHPGVAPTKFSKLRDALTNRKQLEALEPLCRIEQLRTTFSEHSSWFDALRAIDPETRKQGIRDSMEHGQSTILVGKYQGADGTSQIHATLQSALPHVDSSRELISTLRSLLNQLSQFFTGVCLSVGRNNEYGWEDWLLRYSGASGTNATGLWPEI
jgi:hypothetical protein